MQKKSDKYLKYKLGRMLPPVAIYGGYLFMLVGIVSIIFGNPYLGAGVILLGILISFTFRGVIIDVKERKVFTYTSIFWIKRDKVIKEISEYNIITVNRSSMSYRTYSWMSKSIMSVNHYYTVFLSKDTSRRGTGHPQESLW